MIPSPRRSAGNDRFYAYPELFGVADNNPFGLKVFAFLKLAGVAFQHHHVFDPSAAPRGQLPYIVDGGHTLGDSDTIIDHVICSRGLAIDAQLSAAQHDLGHMVSRTLDDLYWVMSYSRWHDGRFWPLFCAALLDSHPELTAEALQQAKDYNAKRYYYRGIGRYERDQVYARGLADLQVVANLLGDQAFLFGDAAHSVDAGAYGFLANIHFYDIDMPLKAFVQADARLVGLLPAPARAGDALTRPATVAAGSGAGQRSKEALTMPR